MKKLRIILLLFLTNLLYSQNETGLEICFQLQEYTKNFTTDYEADLALEKILSTIGASKNFILIPCDEIQNAVAITFKGDRYILYDKNFMTEISSITNKWSDLFILAHEVGHHINGHTRDFLLSKVLDSESLENQRNDELEADEWAAFVVSKLGASLKEIENIIELLGSNKNDLYSTHPDKTKRLAAVKKGYDNAESQKEVVVVESESTGLNKTSEDLFNESLPIDSKDRLIPRLRQGFLVLRTNGYKYANYNQWFKSSENELKYVLRNRNVDENDIFEVEKWEKYRSLLTTYSRTKAEPLQDRGTQQLEIFVTQTQYKRRENRYKEIDGKIYDIVNLGYDAFRDVSDDLKFSQYKKYGFPEHYEVYIGISNFLEMPRGYILKDVFANFEYVFDNGVRGELTSRLRGWYDVDSQKNWDVDTDNNGIMDSEEDLIFKSSIHYPWPESINFNELITLSEHHFKSYITLFNNLKKANILYLRLKEVFLWNGYSDNEKMILDTSKIYRDKMNSLLYNPVTYKIDLKGSSKALLFEEID